MRQKHRKENIYTAREYAASIAFEALYYAARDRDLLPDETKSYRTRVRKAALKMLDDIAVKHRFDYSPPDIERLP